MARLIPVDDPADPRLHEYVALNDADLRRAADAEAGRFIAESAIVVNRLLASPLRVRSVLVMDRKLDTIAAAIADRDLEVYVAPRAVFNAVVGFDLHRGVVAAADRPPEPDLEATIASAATIAVLEGLADQENLGAILRSAAALGIDAVVLDPTCADPWYRRTVRVSMGAGFTLPIARAARWPEDLGRLHRAGFATVALVADPTAPPIDALPQHARVALLLGAEGPGLRPETVAAATHRVTIPMRAAAGLDSLNVGHAAAIAFHHAGRP